MQPITPPAPKGVFYGGYSDPVDPYTSTSNTVTQISESGSLLSAETAVGTPRRQLAGMRVGETALYTGGESSLSGYDNLVTRLNRDGGLVAAEHAIVSENVYSHAGADDDSQGIEFGGYKSSGAVSRFCTRFNELGVVIGSKNDSTANSMMGPAGARNGSGGYFYDMWHLVRLDERGEMIGKSTSVGVSRKYLAGASDMDAQISIYYGGYTMSNLCTRVDSSGMIVGSETSVGTKNGYLAGASVGFGLYYGGRDYKTGTDILLDTVTRISGGGVMMGVETSIGSARGWLAGAGFY